MTWALAANFEPKNVQLMADGPGQPFRGRQGTRSQQDGELVAAELPGQRIVHGTVGDFLLLLAGRGHIAQDQYGALLAQR